AFMHSHTYAGNPLGCSAALAVLKVLDEEQIIPRAQEKAPFFHQLIVDALGDHPHVGEIRYLGLVNAIELVEDRKSRKSFPSERRLGYQIYKEALKQGLLLRPLGDVLYFNPPLVISPEEMQEAVSICAGCIRKVLG
ncbi:aspartate aminotransferase family protein, partial [Akkermansia sp. BIOML-A17]